MTAIVKAGPRPYRRRDRVHYYLPYQEAKQTDTAGGPKWARLFSAEEREDNDEK